MRSFYMRIYKNIIGIYLCILGCFAYTTMMQSIPGHVYLEEGESLTLDQKLPVTLALSDSRKTAMAEVGERTYEMMKKEPVTETCQQFTQGEYALTCYLLGVLPVKEVQVSVVDAQNLYVSGHVVGIYGQAQGVLVMGSSPIETIDGSMQQPTEHIVFPGDYITAVNGETITQKEELMEAVSRYGNAPMVLTLYRGAEQIDVSVTAVKSKEQHYQLGLWVKDDMAGIGTLTYYSAKGNFGALGHGIGDGKTKDLLRLSDGKLYRAQILGIKKGQRGNPGEIEGMVFYGKNDQIGSVSSNTAIGIYGTLTEAFRQEQKDKCYPIGYKQEIKTGNAQIISDVSGTKRAYNIVIEDLDYTPSDDNKGIRFHVEDPKLLELTGGIIQGLSGSPILQDGKIIGAVTHVLVNDPTKGYGIFVEAMVEQNN